MTAACTPLARSVRWDTSHALPTNPVREIARIIADAKAPIRAMTSGERHDLLTKLQQRAQQHATDKLERSLGPRAYTWLDLPDLVRAMLATGVRLGELLALTGDETVNDRDGKPAILINWHLVRVKGHGLVRMPTTKNKTGRLLLLPTWSVAIFTRRKLSSGGTGPLFPSARGGWRDPSNTIGAIRTEFDQCGYDWVTSHVFRKTVATILDEAGLPSGTVADQLGNTRTVAEKHHIAQRATNEQARQALEDAM